MNTRIHTPPNVVRRDPIDHALMKPSAFHIRAVQWLRASQGLSTTVLPGELLEQRSAGGARVPGYLNRPSRAAHWAYSGLCAFTLGAVLMMLSLPGQSPAASVAVDRVGYACHVAGVGCVILAEATRRRNRERAVIELRAKEQQAPTRGSVLALRSDARGAAAWLVAEADFSPEVTAEAAACGIRCFIDRDGRFSELGPAATRRPEAEYGIAPPAPEEREEQRQDHDRGQKA
jgi:hypothetical protein